MTESQRDIEEINSLARQMAHDRMEKFKQEAEKDWDSEEEIKPHFPLSRYHEICAGLYDKAMDRYHEGNFENAYILFMRLLTLITEKLIYHPQYDQGLQPWWSRIRKIGNYVPTALKSTENKLFERFFHHSFRLLNERKTKNQESLDRKSLGHNPIHEETPTRAKQNSDGGHTGNASNDRTDKSSTDSQRYNARLEGDKLSSNSHASRTMDTGLDSVQDGQLHVAQPPEHHRANNAIEESPIKLQQLKISSEDERIRKTNGEARSGGKIYPDLGASNSRPHYELEDHRTNDNNRLKNQGSSGRHETDNKSYELLESSVRRPNNDGVQQSHPMAKDPEPDYIVRYPSMQNTSTMPETTPESRILRSSQIFAVSVGIRNPGSMCYISAPLAVALRLEEFQQFISSHTTPVHPNSVHFLVSRLTYDMAMCEKTGQRSVNLPYGFDGILQSIGLNVIVGESGDAQEAFSCIIEGLATELQAASTPFDMKLDTWRILPNGEERNIPSVEERCLHVSIPQYRLEQPREYWYGSERPLNHPLLRMLSNGSTLSVPLSDCINEYLTPSVPNGSEGDKFISHFELAPQLLMVHLRRTDTDTGADVACSNYLNVACTGNQPNVHYRLRAVISHVRYLDGAGQGGGHYIAVMRYPHSNQCIVCDDASVSIADAALDVATAPQQVYLAIYQRINSR